MPDGEARAQKASRSHALRARDSVSLTAEASGSEPTVYADKGLG